MPIRVNDLKAALEKLEEPSKSLDKPGGIMDQLSGNPLNLAGDMGSALPDIVKEQDAALARAMLTGLSAHVGESIQQSLTAMQHGINAPTQDAIKAMASMQTGIGNIDLGLVPAFNRFLEGLEELEHYRAQAYALITAEDLKHAINHIDWTAFAAAQRPSLTEQEEAADDPIPFLRHEHSNRRCPNRRLNSASSRSLCLIIASLS